MVVDYRAINKLTKRVAFPLPRIDAMLDHLSNSTCYSLIDLRQAYHQAKLVDSDVPKTAFRTPFGHFEYLTLSFGLVNAPSAFQSLMDKLFAPYLYKFCMVYLDDIIIFSKTEQELMMMMRIVTGRWSPFTGQNHLASSTASPTTYTSKLGHCCPAIHRSSSADRTTSEYLPTPGPHTL
jgi:hypothetical protein